jgi:hypothetical protein
MFPLSTPFLLTKPGERMIMYLCARDIDVSSFYTFFIDQSKMEIEGQKTQWAKKDKQCIKNYYQQYSEHSR